MSRLFGDGAYAWQRQWSDTHFTRSLLPAWSLKLDLFDDEHELLGAFTVYRACNDKPLLADINLLTTEFRAALARAMARAKDRADERLLNVEPELVASM